MSIGELEILSVGRGHLTLTITEGNSEEVDRAKRTIADMLQRGYAIFVQREAGKPLVRVKRFDAGHLTYIIEDGPTPDAPAKEERVKASRVKATVVGRTAGG